MKEDKVYLSHIIQSIDVIETFLKECTKEQFLHNIEKQFAVVRGLEIIGEAVKNLSSAFREEHTFIGWRDIAGTRDVLIHAYFSVDVDLVWNIVKKDLPDLKKEISVIIGKEIHK
ncbi:TPA: DUF86 domain-containing protein [Candidatus Woesearchaeota archaeon]|nr:DUF86 domain-containing protein [Candidatus Woesearchaeota archaeon]